MEAMVNTDYWIVKLTTDGSLDWQTSLGGSGVDVAQSARQTSDNGYIVAGYSGSTGGDVTGQSRRLGLLGCKVRRHGILHGRNHWGEVPVMPLIPLIKTSYGDYIVAGGSASNDGDMTINHGNSDYWLVKLDGSGNLIWHKIIWRKS